MFNVYTNIEFTVFAILASGGILLFIIACVGLASDTE